MTLPDLVAWNNVTDPNQIHVGQTIRVAPSGKAPVAIAAPGGAVATPVPPTGTEAGAVPLVREPIGGRAPVAEPAVPEQPAPAVSEPAPAAASGQWQWPSAGSLVAGYNEAPEQGPGHRWQCGRPGIRRIGGQGGICGQWSAGLRQADCDQA